MLLQFAWELAGFPHSLLLITQGGSSTVKRSLPDVRGPPLPGHAINFTIFIYVWEYFRYLGFRRAGTNLMEIHSRRRGGSYIIKLRYH